TDFPRDRYVSNEGCSWDRFARRSTGHGILQNSDLVRLQSGVPRTRRLLFRDAGAFDCRP
ncbi:MAG: hypothetical protein ABIU05_04445, partial [Nitrospirales bacterium]